LIIFLSNWSSAASKKRSKALAAFSSPLSISLMIANSDPKYCLIFSKYPFFSDISSFLFIDVRRFRMLDRLSALEGLAETA
jgi:hypothetical protein